jgi:hypothetical protein
MPLDPEIRVNLPELSEKKPMMQKKTKILIEGGSLPGVGAIHIDEIKPTLLPLQKFLGIDLINNMLGSAGKKTISGDIDIAIDLSPEEIPEFIEKLKKYPGISDVKKTSVIMAKVKIIDYNPNIKTDKPRTGYVQIDFMPGEISWLKTFYHAPYEKDSKYKGVYRNLLLSSIAMFLDRKESKEKLPDGRPKEIERYLWSPSHGLVRVIRRPRPNKKGDGYNKSNIDEIIDGPYKNPEDIVKILKLDSVDDLYSYETLKKAINKNYNPSLVKKIMADFKDNPIVRQNGIPNDLVLESFDSDWFRFMMDIIK